MNTPFQIEKMPPLYEPEQWMQDPDREKGWEIVRLADVPSPKKMAELMSSKANELEAILGRRAGRYTQTDIETICLKLKEIHLLAAKLEKCRSNAKLDFLREATRMKVRIGRPFYFNANNRSQ